MEDEDHDSFKFGREGNEGVIEEHEFKEDERIVAINQCLDNNSCLKGLEFITEGPDGEQIHTIGNVEGSQSYIEFDVPQNFYVVGAKACQDEDKVRGLEFTLMKIII